MVKEKLNQGVPARNISLNKEEIEAIRRLNLLTMKPVIYVFNVSEKQLEDRKKTEEQIVSLLHLLAQASGFTDFNNNGIMKQWNNFLYLNAKLETDVLTFSEEEQKEYLKQFNLEETGLNRLIKKAYETLGLISFLTAGEKEVRAWTIEKGTLAPQAAAVIHTDFEKHFIKADIITYDDFVKADGWIKGKESGKVLSAGKEYLMKEGDIVDFKVGV